MEGTRPLILRMAVGTGPLITGRLRLLINRNVLSESFLIYGRKVQHDSMVRVFSLLKVWLTQGEGTQHPSLALATWAR
jgi:hypothetical protein